MSKGPYWDRAWNWARGCSHASTGCQNCWAEKMATRFSRKGLPFHGLVKDGRWNGKVRFVPSALKAPLHVRKPARWFMDMADPFHEALTFEQIAAAFGVAAACPQHTFLLVTKRPERMRAWFQWIEDEWGEARRSNSYSLKSSAADICTAEAVSAGAEFGPLLCASVNAPWPLANVRLGVSVEDQKSADERVPLLLKVPAAVRWVSAEPLLEEIVIPCLRALDWVVVGSEAGPGARPCEIEWIRRIVDSCLRNGAQPFVKQIRVEGKPVKDATLFPWAIRFRELP